MIAREQPYCLFLDELNACSQDVQKAFYSLTLERRVGEYLMPEGSIVIAAGNRAQDSAIVRTMSSALINRMIHVQLKVSASEWLQWAQQAQLHTLGQHMALHGARGVQHHAKGAAFQPAAVGLNAWPGNIGRGALAAADAGIAAPRLYGRKVMVEPARQIDLPVNRRLQQSTDFLDQSCGQQAACALLVAQQAFA